MTRLEEDRCLETNLNQRLGLETVVNRSKDQGEAVGHVAGNSTPWGNDPTTSSLQNTTPARSMSFSWANDLN